MQQTNCSRYCSECWRPACLDFLRDFSFLALNSHSGPESESRRSVFPYKIHFCHGLLALYSPRSGPLAKLILLTCMHCRARCCMFCIVLFISFQKPCHVQQWLNWYVLCTVAKSDGDYGRPGAGEDDLAHRRAASSSLRRAPTRCHRSPRWPSAPATA